MLILLSKIILSLHNIHLRTLSDTHFKTRIRNYSHHQWVYALLTPWVFSLTLTVMTYSNISFLSTLNDILTNSFHNSLKISSRDLIPAHKISIINSMPKNKPSETILIPLSPKASKKAGLQFKVLRKENKPMKKKSLDSPTFIHNSLNYAWTKTKNSNNTSKTSWKYLIWGEKISNSKYYDPAQSCQCCNKCHFGWDHKCNKARQRHSSDNCDSRSKDCWTVWNDQ